jgi:epoxyqueuosine reductase QueG
VSIGVALNPTIVADIIHGPTKVYEAEYNRINRLLSELSELGSEYLRQQSFEAVSAAATVNAVDEDHLSTSLPHKTVATRAGIGWIGKCALLVTKQFGSAVRLITILTNAAVPVADPVDRSSCGECWACVEICPAGAPSDVLWRKGMARKELFDAVGCYRQTKKWQETRDITRHICGMCIAACPWTQSYLKRSGTLSS